MRQSVPGCGGGGQEEIIAVAFAPQLPLVAAADSAGKMDDLHYVDRYSSPVLSFGSSSARSARVAIRHDDAIRAECRGGRDTEMVEFFRRKDGTGMFGFLTSCRLAADEGVLPPSGD
jgi:hypothetical protein